MESGPESCTFRFYAELNDLLAPPARQHDVVWPILGTPSVKDTIEAIGVPHTEVGLIIVDGAAASFTRLLTGGERIAVYPPFRRIDVTQHGKLRPGPLPGQGFVLDVHLGRLARYLRLLGFDALYRNDYDDTEIVRLSVADQRIVLTRDRGLLKHAGVTWGHWIRATAPRKQAREVMETFDLRSQVRPFTRCMECNGTLHAAAREAVVDRVPERVAREFSGFSECESCRRVYWRGSHFERLSVLLRHWLQPEATDPADHA